MKEVAEEVMLPELTMMTNLDSHIEVVIEMNIPDMVEETVKSLKSPEELLVETEEDSVEAEVEDLTLKIEKLVEDPMK